MSDYASISEDASSTRHPPGWRTGLSLSSCLRGLPVDDQTQFHNNLRVSIPSGDQDTDAALSCPATPSPCTAKQLLGQRRWQAPAPLKLALSPANSSSAGAGLDPANTVVSGGCPTARRLLIGDDSYAEVSSWLDQQTGMMGSNRRACSNMAQQGTHLALNFVDGGAFAGSAAAELVARLPPPAFQVLGLL